ncbi:MAG TPA: hypothetical protein PKE00_04555 [Planctomycetota bacterium]|nr:hypothetical protein [Planctomycetota bacterium]
MRLGNSISLFAPLLTLACVLSQATIRAQNYIGNGSFESKQLAPWFLLGEENIYGYHFDRGFWWLNKPVAALKQTGVAQRLFLPQHDGLWMLSVESYGGALSCHYFRIRLDGKQLLNGCLGRDALHQWLLPLAPGAHVLEIVASQLGTTEASLVRSATLTKVEIPCAVVNQFRATANEMTVLARPFHFVFLNLAPRRLAEAMQLPGVHGGLWLSPAPWILPFGPYLVGPEGRSQVSLNTEVFEALRGHFVQILSIDPQSMTWRLGTRNWFPAAF